MYKNRRLVDKIEPSRIRYHQRKFLVAICALRKLKTSQRKLDENRVSLGDVAKTTAHSHDLMRDVHTTQVILFVWFENYFFIINLGRNGSSYYSC